MEPREWECRHGCGALFTSLPLRKSHEDDCELCICGHGKGEHDENECRGGEDVICSCECFE